MWDLRNYKADYQRAASAEQAPRTKLHRMTEQRQSLAEEAAGLSGTLEAAKAAEAAAEKEYKNGRRGEASLEEVRRAAVAAERRLAGTVELITNLDVDLEKLRQEVTAAAEETEVNSRRYWEGVAIGSEEDFRRLAIPLLEQLAALRVLVRGGSEIGTLADIAADLCGSRRVDENFIAKKATELAAGHGIPVPARKPN